MSYAKDEWLSRCLKLWVIWLGVGAVCFLIPQSPGLRELMSGLPGEGDLWEYPVGIAPQIVGVPALLWALNMIGHAEPYRPLAIGIGCAAAVVHLLVTTYGLPGVQFVYIGMGATAPSLTATARHLGT